MVDRIDDALLSELENLAKEIPPDPKPASKIPRPLVVDLKPVDPEGAKILSQINTAGVMDALGSTLGRKIKPEIFEQLPKANAVEPADTNTEPLAEK